MTPQQDFNNKTMSTYTAVLCWLLEYLLILKLEQTVINRYHRYCHCFHVKIYSEWLAIKEDVPQSDVSHQKHHKHLTIWVPYNHAATLLLYYLLLSCHDFQCINSPAAISQLRLCLGEYKRLYVTISVAIFLKWRGDMWVKFACGILFLSYHQFSFWDNITKISKKSFWEPFYDIIYDYQFLARKRKTGECLWLVYKSSKCKEKK